MSLRTRLTTSRRRPRPARSQLASAAGCAALALILGGASPAPGDWLVTTDGERIETQGAWRVEGARVIFHLPNGTLSSLRADRVDLEQSRLASAERPLQPAPARESRAPALVLNDGDVPRAPEAAIRAAVDPDSAAGGSDPDVPAAPGAAEGSADGDAEAGAPATDRRPDLEVTSWREESAENGIRFLGTLANGSPDFAAMLTVEVSLYDEGGALLETQPARLGATSLAPGATTAFDVTFDGIYSYGEAIFAPDGRSLRSRPPSAPADAAEDDEDAPPEDDLDEAVDVAPEAATPISDQPPPR